MRKPFLILATLCVLAAAAIAPMAGASTPNSAKAVKSSQDACPTDPTQQITNASLDVQIGGISTATFTVPDSCTYVQVSLVSYNSAAPLFTWDNASQQTIYDQQTLTVGPGTRTISVHTPDCYYQLDLVGGTPIAQLGPADSDNFYSRQGRLITSSNGGTQACGSMTAWTAPPTPLPPAPKVTTIKVAGKKVKDVCTNLKGVQAKTPHGYKRQGSICTKPKPKAKPKVKAPTTLPYTP